MLGRAKHTGIRLRNFNPFRKHTDLSSADVAEARQYIAGYWQRLERFHPKDDQSLLGLPNHYLVPASEEGHEFDFNEMYYWDSYFMSLGVMDTQHKELVVGILENLLFTFRRFQTIPNASRTYLMGRSQPPFLTSFIWEVYDAYGMDKAWLKAAIETAEQEYRIVWTGTMKPNARQIYRGLSRYYDINYIHDLAEAESGWDMTPRFNRKCLDHLAVDLNSLLYKYEMDFARYYRLVEDKKTAGQWESAAKHRRSSMNDLMWSNTKGQYYDYNFMKSKRSSVSSLAGFYPLWAGLATNEQALQMMRALKRFENRGGLATTDVQPLSQFMPGQLPTQWAYPNGWAPLHYLVIKGLERYGYHDEAKRIAMKWLRTNLDWFNRHHEFLEKYNVVQPVKPPQKGLYPSQTGFGWTNAVFEKLCQEYLDK